MTEPVTIEPASAEPVSVQEGLDLATILERSTAIRVKSGKFGITRKLNAAGYETESEKDWVRASKTIIQTPAYTAIGTVVSRTKGWLQNLCMPSPLAPGIYMVPNALVEQVADHMEEERKAWEEAVERFLKVYPDKIVEASAALKGNFNPLDYPTVEVVRKKFDFGWGWYNFGTPESLPARLRTKEIEKQRVMIHQYGEDVRSILYTNMAELVEVMQERLTGTDAKGRPKMIREDKLDSIRAMLSVFKDRNLVGDEELNSFADQARELLEGMHHEQLMSSPEARDRCREGFGSIADKLEGYVQDKPVRRLHVRDIDKDETEEAA